MNKQLLKNIYQGLKPFVEKNNGNGNQGYTGKIETALKEERYLDAKNLAKNWLNMAKERGIYINKI